jgi:HEPN domain-containing protein
MQKLERSLSTAYKAWLVKARSDFKMAIAGEKDPETFDGAVYHTQQCAEKALKAFLVFKKQPIRKIHDLGILLESCIGLSDDFIELKELVRELNPYATYFRYPDDEMMPAHEDVSAAIQAAREILQFVEVKISKATDQNTSIF